MRVSLVFMLLFCSGGVVGAETSARGDRAEFANAVLRELVESSSVEGVTAEETILAHFAELVRLAGNGFRHTERAAFLVLDDRDQIQCLLWPKSMSFRREGFRGAIPLRTIAIVHTHPNDRPRPSRADRREAMRLRMPFIVLTSRNIYEISVDGTPESVVSNRRWFHADSMRAGLCRPLAAFEDSNQR